MNKKSFLKKSGIGTAILAGALNMSAANGSGDLKQGVLVSKNDKTATIRDCETGKAITLAYASEESRLFLVGESIGYNRGLLVEHYPNVIGCGFFHS